MEVLHFGCLIALAIIAWALYPKRSRRIDGTRSLGRMETTLHSIYKSCGYLNNAVSCQLNERLDTQILSKGLEIVQKKYSILQTTVIKKGMQYPEYRYLSKVKGIPLVVVRKSLPNEWKTVIQKELNTDFIAEFPLIRCTVLQPVEENGSSDLVLSARSDIMDTKSVVSLLSEVLELYSKLSGDKNTLENFEDITPAPIPPPTDTLLYKVPGPLLFATHCFSILRRHTFNIPDRVPHTNFPEENRNRNLGWTSKLITHRLNPAVTSSLLQRISKGEISVESLFYSVMLFAIARMIRNERENSDDIRLWGILVKDMREAEKSYTCGIGVGFSLVDMVNSLSPEDLENVENVWQIAKKITSESKDAIRSREHLTSMAFTEYLSYITSLYSKYFRTPTFSPSFALYYLGNIDEQNLRGFNSHFPSMTSTITAVNSSTTSFPLPIMTSYIHKKKLCTNMSYSSETSSTQAMNGLMQEFNTVLSSLYSSL